jgi:hypothetical protein
MSNTKLIISTATLALAITFTLSCSDDGGGSGGGGGTSKTDCIRKGLEISANTLDHIAEECEARLSEVLSQLPNLVGNCPAKDLDSDKPIRDIKSECGVEEMPIVSSSSSSKGNIGGKSSSSGGGSSFTWNGTWKVEDNDDKENEFEISGNEFFYKEYGVAVIKGTVVFTPTHISMNATHVLGSYNPPTWVSVDAVNYFWTINCDYVKNADGSVNLSNIVANNTGDGEQRVPYGRLIKK